MSAYLGDKLVSLTAHIDYNTNDATAGVGDVLQGEVFYNAEGRQVGEYVPPTVDELLPALSNPAGTEQILSGYQAIDMTGTIITGVMAEKTLTITKHLNNGDGGWETEKIIQLDKNKNYFILSFYVTKSSSAKYDIKISKIIDNNYSIIDIYQNQDINNDISYNSDTGELVAFGGHSEETPQRIYIVEV